MCSVAVEKRKWTLLKCGLWIKSKVKDINLWLKNIKENM